MRIYDRYPDEPASMPPPGWTKPEPVAEGRRFYFEAEGHQWELSITEQDGLLEVMVNTLWEGERQYGIFPHTSNVFTFHPTRRES